MIAGIAALLLQAAVSGRSVRFMTGTRYLTPFRGAYRPNVPGAFGCSQRLPYGVQRTFHPAQNLLIWEKTADEQTDSTSQRSAEEH